MFFLAVEIPFVFRLWATCLSSYVSRRVFINQINKSILLDRGDD